MTQPKKYELELLKAAAHERYEKGKGKWSRLLKALYLSPTYVPAIQEILGQAKWRNQTNPIAYVRKAAVKWAVQHGIVEIRRKSSKDASTYEINREGGERDTVAQEYRLISELCQFGEEQEDQQIVDRLSPGVVNEHREVNWEKAANLANLDPGEKIVLDLRLMGLRWRDSVAACLTHEDRTILNTAWRRFDRHKDLLKQVLLTGKAQEIRRTASVPELELMFTEGEEQRLKIFFKKSASR
jgi:hypothetical protein